MLSEKVYHFQGPGSPSGELCVLYELIKPYHRMFSPHSWRFIDVNSIDMEGLSWMENQRQSSYVSVVGYFDNYFMAGHIYSNGTLKEVTIGRDKFDFFNFEDLSALDQAAIDDHKGLNALTQPESICEAGGGLTIPYARKLQHMTPWLLFKPTQNAKLRADRGPNIEAYDRRQAIRNSKGAAGKGKQNKSNPRG